VLILLIFAVFLSVAYTALNKLFAVFFIHYICDFTEKFRALCSLFFMLCGTISILFHNWGSSHMLYFRIYRYKNTFCGTRYLFRCCSAHGIAVLSRLQTL